MCRPALRETLYVVRLIPVVQCLYHYHCHQWRIAWRLLGNVTRIIIELGLNHRVVLDRSFPDDSARGQALTMLWSVYVLERQLKYALGLGTTSQDFFLDSNLPDPVIPL